MIKKLLVALVLIGAALLSGGSPVYATGDKPHPKCAAYVYRGTGTTLCHDFPGDRDRNCEDIGRAVELVQAGVDPWHLNRDGDRYGCDQPGGPGTTRPTTPATTRPTTTPTTRPATTEPTTVPTTEPTATATTTPPAASGTGKGPQLPLTGPPTWGLAAAGAVLLLVGAVSLLLIRRRRTRFQA